MAILLSKTDIIKALDMSSAMNMVERAFADLFMGEVVLPQRIQIHVPEENGVALFMPAYIRGMSAIGAKILAIYNNNPVNYNLPAVMGTIILLNEVSGKAEAIMDGGFITAMRTGAAAGVATKYMAREDVKTAALIGTGGQARTQAWALCEARRFEIIFVYSLDSHERIESFCNEMSYRHGVPFEPAHSAEDAIRQADVITLATSSKEPVIDGDWIKPGTHINAIGSHEPTVRELDEKTVLKSRIIADYTEACLAEAGDFIIPRKEGKFNKDMIAGDLGAVVTGNLPGRTSPEDITLFKSVGLAMQDVSTAMAVFKRALEMKVGTEFDFSA